MDFKFLGDEMKAFEASYEVRYDFENDQWIMYAGAMHNIFPSTDTAKSIIRVMGKDGNTLEAEILKVDAARSVLDEKALTNLEKDYEQYRATIVSMANPPVIIGLSAHYSKIQTC